MTKQQVPESIYRYFLSSKDLIAGWSALSPLVSSVDTNRITIKMLYQYICHRGGIATKNSTHGGRIVRTAARIVRTAARTNILFANMMIVRVGARLTDTV